MLIHFTQRIIQLPQLIVTGGFISRLVSLFDTEMNILLFILKEIKEKYLLDRILTKLSFYYVLFTFIYFLFSLPFCLWTFLLFSVLKSLRWNIILLTKYVCIQSVNRANVIYVLFLNYSSNAHR